LELIEKSSVKSDITSIAIGGFDGMHLGHQELFKHLDKNGAIVVIQTDYANLTPKRYRDHYSSYPIFFYELHNIKHLSAKEFLVLLNEEFQNLKKIVVGFDFHFGYKAAYNTEDLRFLFKGEVVVVNEFKVDNIAVHSRVIRDYLRDGNIELANRLLGYNYNIEGIHIVGQGLGSKEFVPTINIDVNSFLIPKDGVYITKTTIKNKTYNSITFIGERKTTDQIFAVETHILDSSFTNLDYKNIKIEFLKIVRDNRKFQSFEELKKQIKDDIQISTNHFL